MNKIEKEKKKEIEEMKKLDKFPGIEDIVAIYGEYQKLMEIATEYLKETEQKFIFSTTDSSY